MSSKIRNDKSFLKFDISAYEEKPLRKKRKREEEEVVVVGDVQQKKVGWTLALNVSSTHG